MYVWKEHEIIWKNMEHMKVKQGKKKKLNTENKNNNNQPTN